MAVTTKAAAVDGCSASGADELRQVPRRNSGWSRLGRSSLLANRAVRQKKVGLILNQSPPVGQGCTDSALSRARAPIPSLLVTLSLTLYGLYVYSTNIQRLT